MVNYRSFEISDELFGGFTLKINLDDIDCLEDIIAYTYHALINDRYLFEKLLVDTTFHIHDYTMTDLLLSDSKRIFYICGHC